MPVTVPISAEWAGSVAAPADPLTVLLQVGGGGTPGGSDTQLQLNAAGAFAGTTGLTWNAAAGRLTHQAASDAQTLRAYLPNRTAAAPSHPKAAGFFFTSTENANPNDDGTYNHVFQFGHNYNAGGRVEPGLGAIVWSMEGDWNYGPLPQNIAQECHLVVVKADGTTNRALSFVSFQDVTAQLGCYARVSEMSYQTPGVTQTPWQTMGYTGHSWTNPATGHQFVLTLDDIVSGRGGVTLNNSPGRDLRFFVGASGQLHFGQPNLVVIDTATNTMSMAGLAALTLPSSTTGGTISGGNVNVANTLTLTNGDATSGAVPWVSRAVSHSLKNAAGTSTYLDTAATGSILYAPTSGAVPATLQMASGQAVDIAQFKSSTGAVRGSFGNSGNRLTLGEYQGPFAGSGTGAALLIGTSNANGDRAGFYLSHQAALNGFGFFFYSDGNTYLDNYGGGDILFRFGSGFATVARMTSTGTNFYPPAAGNVPVTLRGALSQTGNLLDCRDSATTLLSAIDCKGAWHPPSLADSAAQPSSLYYSTTASKLAFKDAGGTVNLLY